MDPGSHGMQLFSAGRKSHLPAGHRLESQLLQSAALSPVDGRFLFLRHANICSLTSSSFLSQSLNQSPLYTCPVPRAALT